MMFGEASEVKIRNTELNHKYFFTKLVDAAKKERKTMNLNQNNLWLKEVHELVFLKKRGHIYEKQLSKQLVIDLNRLKI